MYISNECRKKYRKIINVVRPFYNLIYKITHKNEYEKKCSFGNKNEEKTFYVIRSNNSTAGMFSIINTVLEHIAYARDKGYIPVVDMKNYPNSYLEQDKIGAENSWEYFFHQPRINDVEYSLDEVYSSKKVILSSLKPIVKNYHFDSSICDNLESSLFKQYRKLFFENVILKTELKERFEDYRKELFGEEKVLGVLCRGTDYVTMKPYAHPIQPTIAEVIKKTKTFLDEFKYNKIYLATEDADIVKEFQTEFKDKLLIYSRDYFKKLDISSREYITEIINQSVSPKNAGVEYLGQIYLLTKCESLILAKTSATPAVLFSGGYKQVFVWNLGLYGIDD